MASVAERRKEINLGLVQDVKEIKDILLDMQKSEAARWEREKAMRKDVDDLKEAINGNGKPGIKTDVQRLSTDVSNLNKSDEKREASNRAIIIAIVIQIILLVLSKVF